MSQEVVDRPTNGLLVDKGRTLLPFGSEGAVIALRSKSWSMGGAQSAYVAWVFR